MWWERERDTVEVTLIVPEWHSWTVRQRYLARGRIARAIASFRARARACRPRRALVSVQRMQLDELHAARDRDAARRIELRRAQITRRRRSESLERAAQRCRALITDSHFAQGELARELRLAPERLVPIELGVSSAATARAGDTRRRRRSSRTCSTSERPNGARASIRCSRRWLLVARERPDLSLVVTTRLARSRSTVPSDVRRSRTRTRGRAIRWPRSIARARCSPFHRATKASACRCSRR